MGVYEVNRLCMLGLVIVVYMGCIEGIGGDRDEI